jgi:hypothetical protein
MQEEAERMKHIDGYRTGELRRWRRRQLARTLMAPAAVALVLVALLSWAASALL